MSLGSILNVNLTNGKINIEEFSAELAAACLGGLGFNTTVLYEQIASGVDPLSPANILALSCGLLTGTAAPASSRIHVSARSPLSGLMGSSNAGGLVHRFVNAMTYLLTQDLVLSKQLCWIGQ